MAELPNSIKQRLEAAAKGPHPEAEMLAAFTEQALSPPERESILLHLAACGDCREIVALSLPEEVVALAETRQRRWFGMPYRVMQWSAAGLAAAIVLVAVVLVPKEQSQHPQTEAAYSKAAPAAAEVKSPSVSEARQADLPAKMQPPRATEGSAGKPVEEDAAYSRASERGKAVPPPPPPAAAAPAPGRNDQLAESSPLRQPAAEAAAVQGVVITGGKATAEVASDAASAPGAHLASGQAAGIGMGAAGAMAKAPAMTDEAKKARANQDSEIRVNPAADASAPASARVEKDAQQITPSTANLSMIKMEPVSRLCRLREAQVECGTGGMWQQNLSGVEVAKLAFDQGTYWALAKDGRLFVSLAGSAGWNGLKAPWQGAVKEVRALDAMRAEVETSSGERWQTADGGATWKKQ